MVTFSLTKADSIKCIYVFLLNAFNNKIVIFLD